MGYSSVHGLLEERYSDNNYQNSLLSAYNYHEVIVCMAIHI